jgi:two-component system chemotaxis response regulator CheB
VLAALPAAFPAPILLVRHLAPTRPGMTAPLLQRRLHVRIKEAEAGEMPLPGTVYVAPPDRHLLVSGDGTLALSQSPRVNLLRPAADPLFMSAARTYGRLVVAVVLTGLGSDGARGVQAVKAAGGVVLAQDARGCAAPSMPSAAIGTGCVDFALSLSAIAAALISLLMVPGAAQLFTVERPSAA